MARKRPFDSFAPVSGDGFRVSNSERLMEKSGIAESGGQSFRSWALGDIDRARTDT